MSSQVSRALLAGGGVVAFVALLISASAASLGGISLTDLFAWSAPVTVPVPVVVGFDHFTCAGDLDGKSDDYGNAWADHGGGWRCVGSAEVDARQPQTLAHATVDLGVSENVYLTARISDANAQPNRSGPGVSFLSNGVFHMFVIYQRDQGLITLGKFDGTRSILASTPISDRASTEIRVEIEQPTITVMVDGAGVLTYTMTTIETAAFGGNTRFGMELDDDNKSRFDWFQAEAL